MAEADEPTLGRREFVQAAVCGAALAAAPGFVLAASRAAADKAAVLAQVPKMHAQNVKRLQDWIALPSIAAENRNFPQGPQYMMKLAEDAGFTGVKLIPSAGKPGVFGRIDAGAPTTVGIYFMYDVKQFVPEEWSSPPLEARLVQKEGLGTVCMGRGAVNQKGPENSFLSALRHCHAPRGDARPEEVCRHLRAGSRPGSRRRGPGLPRRQGGGGAGADLEWREVGPRPLA
jgi:hypothetical protein